VEEVQGLLLEAVRHRLEDFGVLAAEITVDDIKVVINVPPCVAKHTLRNETLQLASQHNKLYN